MPGNRELFLSGITLGVAAGSLNPIGHGVVVQIIGFGTLFGTFRSNGFDVVFR